MANAMFNRKKRRRANLKNGRIVKLQSVVDNCLKGKNNIRALEAGCGAKSYIKFKQNAYIVGIDISEKQLQRNTTVDEKILGDIQFYDLKPCSFDAIISRYVLEHVPKPQLALKNFLKALKEEGIIVLVLPNVMSLKGLLTKFTPHWIHILVKRYIFKKKNAGKDDATPFKTYNEGFYISNINQKIC